MTPRELMQTREEFVSSGKSELDFPMRANSARRTRSWERNPSTVGVTRCLAVGSAGYGLLPWSRAILVRRPFRAQRHGLRLAAGR